MRKKTWVLCSVIVLSIIFLFVTAYSQDNIKYVQDPAFTKRMRPAAVFNHDEHNENASIDDCSTCHHFYKDKVKVENETSEDMKCSECHKIDKDPVPLINKYHLRCKGCHEQEKAGPLMCSECHVK
ncbi:MAG: cytochrome c3 family protein [Desulfobacterium sp.]|nr:cytochrome c3 family protein [Desulfobacterium sp.]MBU3947370.1 cytochrome c family protein [Pseudomonadota bacterium]MBU4037188.1 cytochrome c family protein [Pseudomonadota bacterium]